MQSHSITAIETQSKYTVRLKPGCSPHVTQEEYEFVLQDTAMHEGLSNPDLPRFSRSHFGD